MEYARYFNYAGVQVKNENEGKNIPYLGLASKKTEGRIFVSSVARNSAAWVDGINVNDELISIDGTPIEAAVERMPAITDKKVGDEVVIRVARDGMLKDIKVTLKATPNVKLVGVIDEDASELQKAVRKAVLF
ncbi:serine endoprotease [compost metagenome]